MHDSQTPPQRTADPQAGGRGAGQTYYTYEHDFHGPAKLTTTVAHAIADVSGADVSEVGTGINHRVDPRALDGLFSPKPGGAPRVRSNLTFDIWDHLVTVHCDGLIVVTPPAYRA